MPCRDYESEQIRVEYRDDPIIQELKDRLDKVTKLLCYVLGRLEKKGKIGLAHGANSETGDELFHWWENHKRLDAENSREELLKRFNNEFTSDEQIELSNIL